MKSLYVVVAVLFASIIVAAAQETAYNTYVFQQVPEGTNLPPLGREGTAYGNVGGRQVYFAGGVNTLYPSASSFTAFKDVYAYDTAKNVFYRSPTDLPGPSYFGVGFALDTKLYIYSGRTNSAGSQSANTYFNDMYVVDYSTDVANPTVTTVPLTPPVASRQYASGFLTKKGLFLIFGGVNGPSGSTAVSSDEVFFAIDTKANGLTAKIACGTNCPATSVVTPAVFMNQAETKFYVYGGMLSDSQTFADNTKLYVYDLDDEEWKTPITISNPAKLVWNSWALNADVSRLLLVGGDNGTGSDVKSWAWDLTTDPPKLAQLPAMLPYRCESAMVGIDANGTAWLYSGAIYNSPTDGSAAQYLHGVLKFVPNPYTPPSEYDSCMFPEVCTEFDLMQIDTGHVLLGLFLSLCAGLGTLAGGLITFLPGAGEGNIWFVGGLGIAGGVMLWISLRELFPTAESYFCCDYSQHYITATTIAFFIGLLFGIALDFLVQWASRMETQNDTIRKYLCCKWSGDYEEIADSSANEMEERKRLYEDHGDQAATVMEMMSLDTGGAPSERMTKMGIINALVVAIHNFPEGVATFMATLASPPLGLAVAVAICSHNIPEGFAIALPLNVGTGNKVRALVYTFFAGMAEPLGALAGWIIFSRFIGPWLFGAMFGVIAGLLTYISLHEIIPVAHKFDPTDRYSTYFILLGILLMIITLVVFIDF